MAAIVAVTTGIQSNGLAQVDENEPTPMKILIVSPPASCVKESAVTNIGNGTAPLPVVYQPFLDTDGEAPLDDKKKLGEWLKEKEVDGGIWFSCEDSSVHLYVFTDQWLSEKRALNPDSPRTFEDAISVIVEYWMQAIVPKWQKAQEAATQDVLANLHASTATAENEKNERPIVPPKPTATVTSSRETTPVDERLAIRGGRINLEAAILGVLVKSRHFLPGVQGCAGGKISSRIELYAKGGILKARDAESQIQESLVKATIKSVLFGMGIRMLRSIKTGTLDLTLMLEGVIMPYETVVSTGESQNV